MLERDVSKSFSNVFSDLRVMTVANATVAGWPDRFVQLPKSKLIAVELKRFQVNRTGYFVVSAFRSTQAAWFAQWQRHGGLGCIFFGLIAFDDRTLGYGFITCKDWREWLDMERLKLVPDRNITIWTQAAGVRVAMQHWWETSHERD